MKNGFYYIIKDEFFNKFTALGCKFKYNKSESRPIFCCIEDKFVKDLFWAIPTGSVNDKKLSRINKYINCDEKDIRHSYYHIGYTNKKAIFYISSAFPITDNYVLREHTTSGIPLQMKRTSMHNEIKAKLFKILTFENRNPNKFETHISTIKSILVKELKQNSCK